MKGDDETAFDAAALRERFDRAFASAPAPGEAKGESFLLVRVGGDPFALRMLEIAEVTYAARVVPLPTSDPAFAGLTSLRGVMVPVFALGVLLGYPPSAAPGTCLARCRHAQGMVAFSFDGAEGFSNGGATTPEGDDLGGGREVVAVGDTVRPVLRVTDLFAGLESRLVSSMNRS